MRIDTSPYSKTFYVWNSLSAVFFYDMVTPPHKHNTMQLIFDIRDVFKCRGQYTDWGIYKSAIIGENTIHQLDTNNSVQLLLYLDAGSEVAKSLRSKYLSKDAIGSLDADVLNYTRPGELEQCLINPDPVVLEQLIASLLNRLTGKQATPAGAVDERITNIIQFLNTGISQKITVSKLAKRFFLSESRLRVLFKESTGVPLHRYIIWDRLMLAISHIMNGATVQDAAIECGFTDSSHFHKLLLQMFGISPSQFIKSNSKKSIQILSRKPLDMVSQIF
jgi:AraC-like DNA-binding protein